MSSFPRPRYLEQANQQRRKKMSKDKKEDSKLIPQHKLMAMGKKIPQEGGKTVPRKK